MKNRSFKSQSFFIVVTFLLWQNIALSQQRNEANGSPQQNQRVVRQFSVVGERAFLYYKPELFAEKIGEFNSKAIITAVARSGEWFEVESPDHGFVQFGQIRIIGSYPDNLPNSDYWEKHAGPPPMLTPSFSKYSGSYVGVANPEPEKLSKAASPSSQKKELSYWPILKVLLIGFLGFVFVSVAIGKMIGFIFSAPFYIIALGWRLLLWAVKAILGLILDKVSFLSSEQQQASSHQSGNSNNHKEEGDASRNEWDKRGKQDYGRSSKDNRGKLPKSEAECRELLGLEGDLNAQIVKQKYRELCLKYHPDKVSHLGEEFRVIAEEKLKAINAAYDFFKDRYAM